MAMATHTATDGSPQNIMDALGAFLATGDATTWFCGGWHPDGAPEAVTVAVGHRWQPVPFEGARLRVELMPRQSAALWRGARLVALKLGESLVWNMGMYDGEAWSANNAVLDMLLLARWPRNYKDSALSEARLLRRYQDAMA